LPLLLFGIPDMADETTRYAIGIPRVGSWILTHTWGGQIKGLKEFPREDRPNSLIVFWSFRVMVGLGLLMIALGAWSLWLRRGARLYEQRLFLHWPCGWGRPAWWPCWPAGSPPRSDASPGSCTACCAPPMRLEAWRRAAGLSLALFVVSYLFVFGVGIAYVLRLVRKGPQAFDTHGAPQGGPGRGRTPARPLSVPRSRRLGRIADRTSVDFDITAIWAAIIFFSVFMYVVLDGFDLGIGMLYPFVPGGASATP
jgi:cytochrome d ubiquinol oxidase subunit I